MKICYLADANSVHTKKWVSYFAKEGHEIVVISLGNGELEGAKVYSFGFEDFDSASQVSKFLSYGSRISEVKKILAKEKPDILHAHYASSYGLIGSLVNYKPYVLSVWGSDVYLFPKSGYLQKKLIEYNLEKADVIMSTSKHMKKETKLYTDKDIVLTPFGVDTEIFKPIEVEKVSDFTVGYIKALHKMYGIGYLIDAYADFLKLYPSLDSKLLIAGKGPDEGELRDQVNKLGIGSHVDFLGFVSQEGVIETFNKMDVAVFPSTESESFGVAAVEAGACGVPTIVSNVGGLPEATLPGKSSITVPMCQAGPITDALVKLYEDENLRLEMAKNARQYVLDNYKIEDNFAAVEKVYEDIIS